MLRITSLSFIISLRLTLHVQAQIPVWVLGNSQQTSSGSFYTLGPNNLKFFNVDFTGATPVTTPRTLGASVNSIISMGTQDVINNMLDSDGNVWFYLFAASQTPYNVGSSPVDTVYFVAPSSVTGADEVFGKLAAESRISSVIEHGLCKKPGSTDRFYFVYKTKAGSSALDDVKYVEVDATNKTVSVPIILKNDDKNSEGMAISPFDCASGKQWVYTATILSGGNLGIWKYEITSSGILPPVLAYTITITGNSGVAVIGGIEISPQGNKLAVCNYNTASPNKEVIVFDLNVATGNLSNERWYVNPSNPIVACEFSSDGSQIYMLQSGSGSFPSELYHRPVIASGSYTLTTSDELPVSLSAPLALERAYDNKIYVVKGANQTQFYYVDNIDSPSPTIGITSGSFYGGIDARIGDGLPDLTDEINNGSVSIAGDLSICSGQSTTLIASGSGSVTWSGGISSTNDTIVVSPSSTTSYTATITDGTCTATETVTVTVTPPPVATIAGIDTICTGETITLSGSGGTTYQWSGGITSSSPSISVTPSSTTTYYLQTTVGSCNSALDTFTVNVVAPPAYTLDDSYTICNGQSIYIFASSASQINWTTPVSSTNDSILVSPVTTTNYFIEFSNGSCSISDTVTVIVNPVPVANISGPDTICVGSTITLTGSGGGTYQWTGGIISASTAVSVSPGASTDYFLQVQNSGCYSSIDTFTVAVVDPPLSTLVNAYTICEGDSVYLVASSDGNITWTSPVSFSGDSVLVSPPVNTSYFVEFSNGFCTTQDTVMVNVNPLPVIDITGVDEICPGSLSVLTASGADTYQWSGASTAVASVISDTLYTTSTYYLVGTANGCTSEPDTFTVTVTTNPTLEILGDTLLCAGDSTTLSVITAESVQWTGGSSATATSITVAPLVNTIYGVYFDNGSCSGSDSVLVVVSPLPLAVISGPDTVCTGDAVTLTANAADQWLWSGAVSSVNDTITDNPVVTTSYILSVTDNGCTSLPDTFTVQVVNVPVAAITGDLTICSGESTTLELIGSTFISWSGDIVSGLNPIDVSPSATSTYIASFTNGYCLGADTAVVTVGSVNLSEIGQSFDECTGIVSFIVTGSGASYYEWDFGDGSFSTEPNATHLYPSNGSYNVLLVAYDDNMCSDTVTAVINYEFDFTTIQFIVPNIITPNGDKMNDEFEVHGLCNYNHVVIFDRWGIVMHESDNIDDYWKGENLRGKPVTEGVYYYVFTGEDGKKLSGHVQVSR